MVAVALRICACGSEGFEGQLSMLRDSLLATSALVTVGEQPRGLLWITR